MIKIKSKERTKSIPVVVLTSSNESKDIKACYRFGANSLSLSLEFDNFVKAVDKPWKLLASAKPASSWKVLVF